MKLPDIDSQLKDRTILILAGTELVAFKHPTDKQWSVKVDSCNRCGECCMDNPPTPFGWDAEGKCTKLVKSGDTWECGAGSNRPYNCLYDPVGVASCSITYKLVKA